MSHQIQASLMDLKGLAAAIKDLEWYTGPSGGYLLGDVTVDGQTVTWTLTTRPVAEPKAGPKAEPERRRVVEPGDQVIVETKADQMARRFAGAEERGVEGTVFRVLTRGQHPRGMKVELRDRTVGRVMKNLTVPGAGEPTGR
ncbi:MAG TPA: DUF2196 domain-containing protein [Symbiobacteriaceae bacterium]|jgi:uncharacterized protein YwbE|nr:DUF2196 domain-containing protein [Symbiobacteriaceae bacterium]